MNGIGLPRRQFLGQSGALITSAAVLNSPLLTQNSKFFNIAHYNRPHIDEQDWSLDITGLVRKPGWFRLSDIRARPRQELIFTLECSGNNGRSVVSDRHRHRPVGCDVAGGDAA